MARPTHEFMDSSQFILVYFDAENTGRKGGALAKAWRNGKHEDRHNISHVPATEGVDPQMQKKSAWVLEMKPRHTAREASHKKASGEREYEVCEQDRHKLNKTEVNWQNVRKTLYIILRTGHWDILTGMQCVWAYTGG